MQAVITRTYKGVHCRAIPGKYLDDDVLCTFRYSVNAYSYLVGNNESLSLSQWADRIEAVCVPSDRLTEVLRVIGVVDNMSRLSD